MQNTSSGSSSNLRHSNDTHEQLLDLHIEEDTRRPEQEIIEIGDQLEIPVINLDEINLTKSSAAT